MVLETVVMFHCILMATLVCLPLLSYLLPSTKPTPGEPMFEHFEEAVSVFLKDPVPWLLLCACWIVAGGVIPVLGALFLLPAVSREAQRSVEAGRGPELSGLIDVENLGRDAAVMGMYLVAQIFGTLCCGVGLLVSLFSFGYVGELAAGLRISALQAMRLSASWAWSNPGPTLGLLVCSWLTHAIGGLLGGVGVFLTTPIVLIAWTLHWFSIRDAVYDLAVRKGFDVAPAPTRM